MPDILGAYMTLGPLNNSHIRDADAFVLISYQYDTDLLIVAAASPLGDSVKPKTCRVHGNLHTVTAVAIH